MVAMAPPLGMATARTNMATAGGSGDDSNDCNKQERARYVNVTFTFNGGKN